MHTIAKMKPVNTLQKEISRLFQLGRASPVPYECSTEADTMMNLYLMDKHGLQNPFHEDIIDDYKRYGRICSRYVPWISPPVHGRWELTIYMDKAGNMLKHNADEIVEIFRDNFIEMTENTPGKKIACEFNSCLFVDGTPVSGHSEMVLFDPAFNVVEYIDSNNMPKQCSRKDKVYFTWTQLRSETIRKIVEGMPTEPILVTNADIYTGYEWGIQSLEAASDLLTENERKGYCLMWSHLFGDLALQFPDMAVKEIVSAIIKKGKLKTIKVDFINDFMLFLIRGYVADISRSLDMDFTSIDSIHAACSKLASKL